MISERELVDAGTRNGREYSRLIIKQSPFFSDHGGPSGRNYSHFGPFLPPGHSFAFKGGYRENGIEKSVFGILAVGNHLVRIIHSWAGLFTHTMISFTYRATVVFVAIIFPTLGLTMY